MIYDKKTQNRKKGGRKSFLSPLDREKVRFLFFDLNWEAQQIRDDMFPEMLTDTLRCIARREQAKRALGIQPDTNQGEAHPRP